MTVTTDDCKRFLANVFATNPMPILQVYRGNATGLEAARDATNPKNWKREYKRKAEDESFLYERKFVLLEDKYDTAVAFLVLEGVNGSLVVGEYVGD